MHRQLKKLLESAHGDSGMVLVVFLDVRGFSSFANFAESLQSTVFLKRAYLRILNDFFADSDFFKPTGDGLMIVRRYDESTLESIVRESVRRSIELVEAFPGITAGDPMINFAVPGDLGIGIARGPSTSLMSGSRTLDYSGRPLNLASRLMDLARPAGVVFDESLGIELLDDELASRFAPEQVYVKGLAEELPMRAYVLRDRVTVPEYAKHPIGRFKRFMQNPEQLNMKEIKQRSPRFLHPLELEPASHSDIVCRVTHPKATQSGTKAKGLYNNWSIPASYIEQNNARYASVEYDKIAAHLEVQRVKRTWPVQVAIEYSVRPDLISESG